MEKSYKNPETADPVLRYTGISIWRPYEVCTTTNLLGDLVQVSEPLCARIVVGIKRKIHEKSLIQGLS